MKVYIKGKEITLKSSVRALIIYEKIMGKTFEPKGTEEILVYFYSTLLASDKDLVLEYEELLDIIDSNPDLMKKFCVWITALNKQNSKIKKA